MLIIFKIIKIGRELTFILAHFFIFFISSPKSIAWEIVSKYEKTIKKNFMFNF